MKDYNGTIYRLGKEVLTDGEAAPGLRAQLRSHVLSNQISAEGTPAAYTYDLDGMRRGLTLARLGQLTRTPRERRADPGPLTEIAEAYADLANRYEADHPRRVELLAIASTMWSLAGYQANASTLAAAFTREVHALFARDELEDFESPTTTAPYRIAALAGAVLRRDLDEVSRLGAQAAEELPTLGQRLIDETSEGRADVADAAVLAAYGLAGRAARNLAALWRSGNRTAGRAAVTDLRKAASVLLDASVADTWTLIDSLAHVAEDIVATSPWLLLRRAATWGRLWERYLRALIVAERPVIQVWPSQRAALDAGLVDAVARNMAVTMPTSAGKTHIAEWAILHALAPQPGDENHWWLTPRLAVYVVPTRALAAQVERHLSESLDLLGLRVSSLFGGAEHVRYETQLLDFTDVLVVTSEKLDLLLRNMPELAQRLALILVDEGHTIDRSERGLRLEMLLTRLRRTAPTARLVLLSAVLPNGDDLARWLDPNADATNLAKINWSPSRLRMGIFSWRGRKMDGQQGAIDYGNGDNGEFFLPSVLTRHLKRVNLFPEAPKDVAAALALHFDRLGPVLISQPTKIKARAAARALGEALEKEGAPKLGTSDDAINADVVQQRLEASAEIGRHIGASHELATMVLRGYAYHHSEVPQAVRHCIERAYRNGALRVLCATSTLSQGMNLPTKTVLVPDTWRGQNDQVSIRDFWNTAGRAGRAGRETEGHVILIAKDGNTARELRRRYLDHDKIEPVISTLAWLYYKLVIARLGHRPESGQDLTALDLAEPTDETLSEWAEALDLQLLALLAEEIIDTPDQVFLEQAAQALLGDTLAGHQLGSQKWSLAPLARFSARRVTAIAQRLPDRPTRAAIIRSGLSVQGGIDALVAAEQIHAALDAHPELLTADSWPHLQRLVLTLAINVYEFQRSARQKRVAASALVPVATDWIAGLPATDLHQTHHRDLLTSDIAATTSAIDKIIVQDLAWVVSALLQLLELRRGVPAEDRLAALPAMIKYGVGSPTACYASSIGIHDRAAATVLAAACPHPEPTLGQFLDWLSQLTVDEITKITDPDTARLLIRSTERRSPRTAQATILSGNGTFTCPLRRHRNAGNAAYLSQLPAGTLLELVRDRNNKADPNAVQVQHQGVFLGWIAREIARPLALALDEDSAPHVSTQLSTNPRALAIQNGTDELSVRNAITLTITLTSR
ncbi:DEAD/DEAH box helicase [Actinomadura sp. DC4]|uniref:DEAD/DEAH box helicase n=1 Tax=Actinomadura sp. DC4 TaxID=3055069 RepID=UPI0025B0E4A7|nr:DEAD/DEAH box helicase [Actinomadura sp. DC4]MDN3356832.1 DEAD/DEAH box helicase [Actinomadura sp. DC4]